MKKLVVVFIAFLMFVLSGCSTIRIPEPELYKQKVSEATVAWEKIEKQFVTITKIQSGVDFYLEEDEIALSQDRNSAIVTTKICFYDEVSEKKKCTGKAYFMLVFVSGDWHYICQFFIPDENLPCNGDTECDKR